MKAIAIFLLTFFLVIVFAAYELGKCCALDEHWRLQQENQQLKQILTDMQHIEELSYKAWCAMTREATRKRPQSQPDPSTKKDPPNTKM